MSGSSGIQTARQFTNGRTQLRAARGRGRHPLGGGGQLLDKLSRAQVICVPRHRALEHPDLPQARFALSWDAGFGRPLPCGPGRIYWFGTSPRPAAPPPAGMKAGGSPLQPLIPVVAAAIETTPESAILRSDIIDRPPTWPWGAGRVTLLGDAIHPTTANLGQGACQALEDAVVLAHCLKQHGVHPNSLRVYESARRRRTTMIANHSWSVGHMLQWENPLAVWLRAHAIRSRFGQQRAMRLFEDMLCYDLPNLDGV